MDEGREQPIPPAEGNNAVSAVAIKPPPFWRDCPDLWFLRLERQFTLAGISGDETKFNYVVSTLEQQYLKMVSDLAWNPPETNKYAAIKKALIDRLSASPSAKLNSLLADVELGDRRPSQFLRELKHLANNAVTEDFLKTLWLKRLPQSMQVILASNPGDLDVLADCADKIADVMDKPSVFATSSAPATQSVDARLSRLESQFDRLLLHMENANRYRPRSKSRSHSLKRQNRTFSKSPARPNWCWFHRKFQDKANKCIDPCSYPATGSHFTSTKK